MRKHPGDDFLSEPNSEAHYSNKLIEGPNFHRRPDRRESVSKAVRRLGRGRIRDALECLKDCDRAEAIHCSRKDIKKVRAVLRMEPLR